MTRAYRPERPSVWADLRAIRGDWRTGAPMLAVFPMVWIAAKIIERIGM